MRRWTMKTHTQIVKREDGRYHAYEWTGNQDYPGSKRDGHWSGINCVGFETKKQAQDALREIAFGEND